MGGNVALLTACRAWRVISWRETIEGWGRGVGRERLSPSLRGPIIHSPSVSAKRTQRSTDCGFWVRFTWENYVPRQQVTARVRKNQRYTARTDESSANSPGRARLPT